LYTPINAKIASSILASGKRQLDLLFAKIIPQTYSLLYQIPVGPGEVIVFVYSEQTVRALFVFWHKRRTCHGDAIHQGAVNNHLKLLQDSFNSVSLCFVYSCERCVVSTSQDTEDANGSGLVIQTLNSVTII
jgi:hypothetical protein